MAEVERVCTVQGLGFKPLNLGLKNPEPQSPGAPAQTKAEVERAFGRALGEVFASFDPRPLASGSIAQVRGAPVWGCRVEGLEGWRVSG